jgi:hypothetical protein
MEVGTPARVAICGLLVGGTATALAWAGQGEVPQVRVATTGNHSELVKTLPITRRPGAEKRVVMSMSPGKLPDLAAGDRVRVSAELQVTNNCNFRSSRCVGPVYHYAPRVRASLVLAGHGDTTEGVDALRLARSQRETCTQRRPDYEHHCVLTFTDAGFDVGDPARLPCRPDRCRINLVADAHYPRAGTGDLLMVGGQRPDGSIPQDRGRINVVRLRGATAGATRTVSTSDPRRRRLRPDLKRRVVYSQRLDHLRGGEQLEVEATLRTGIAHLRYAVRTSARMILADSPRATRQGRFVKGRTLNRGEISENNGSNCTQDKGTCVYRKVGVEAIRRDAVDRSGRERPLYLNLVVVVGPKVRQAQRGDRVVVRRRGGITVRRYGPELSPSRAR